MEAMTCGLPTFATCHGGPKEIIEDGLSGFHIDPYHPDKAADLMAEFFQKCTEDPAYWEKISEGGLQRIYERCVFYNKFINLNGSDNQCTYIIAGIHGRSTLKGS